MQRTRHQTLRTAAIALAAALAAGAASAATVDVYLRVGRTTKDLPGAPGVPVWGYGLCTPGNTPPNTAFLSCTAPTVPGPVIRANAGDTLRLFVWNNLGAGDSPGTQTSVVVPGLGTTGAAFFQGNRVRSFTTEAPTGRLVAAAAPTYTFTSLRPGTFLYQSGTRPSIQVPMGLYGALIVSDPDEDPGYPGVAYQAEQLLLFSEIDVAQNTAVNAAPAPADYPSTIDYNPKYYLINGFAFDSGAPLSSTFAAATVGETPPTVGDTLLLRLANAGLRSHIATVAGTDLDVRAEDANVYPRPRAHSSVLLPAGKTHDATTTIADADHTYTVYDQMGDLTNNDAPDGGMLAYVQLGTGSEVSAGGAGALDDAYTLAEDTSLSGNVLVNDGGLSTAAVAIQPLHGTLSFGEPEDGDFTYTPALDFAGTDTFVYTAGSGAGASTATVVLTVTATNDPPVARPDAYTHSFGLDVPAPGVLANDGDPEGDDPLSALAVGSFPGLGANGAITGGSAGTFQYQACDVTPPPTTAIQIALHCSAPVEVTRVLPPVRNLALNVLGVEPDGSTAAVADYRWLVEEDSTFHPDPANAGAPNLGTSFHRSYMPVVAQGCAGAGCTGPSINELRLDPDKHYYVSVLPRSAGSGEGHTNGGAPIAARTSTQPAQGNVTVYVNRQPLPPAQVSVFVFADHAPTNGVFDGGTEVGLGGFEIVFEDAGGRYGQNGGRMLTDKDGNLLKNAKAGTGDCPASVASTPGVILTCPDGTALIQNLAPAKYGISAVPPLGSAAVYGYVQTSTIEGAKVNDAWVKANEAPFFQEFGPPSYHTFFGFVASKEIGTPGGSGQTVSGRVTNLHMSRPPNQTLWDAETNDALAHTTAWVGLNSAGGTGANIAAVKADGDGQFEIPNVPNGTYELVVWDDYLDQIIAFRTVTVASAAVDLDTIPVFNWFARLEHNVFLDDGAGTEANAQNGRRDANEAPLIEQNINIRFRDGSIYQSYPTDHEGFVPFDQVFPFFNWLVAEVDYARFKPTGVTVTVDAGGAVSSTGNVLNPQIQTEGCSDASCTSRTETGPQLLQAFQGFIGQTSVLDWGKVPYQVGENGGISGIVYYASTRAENNPRLAAADTWEPGIPLVRVRLYREVPANGGGTTWTLVDEVQTDSWDNSLPEGCPGADPGDAAMLGTGNLTKCYDGMRNWNQVRPGVFDGGYAFMGIPPGKYVVEVIPPPGYELLKEEDKNVDFGDAYSLAPAALALPNLALAMALPDQAAIEEALAAQAGEPEPGIAQPSCVGEMREVPPLLALFEDQGIEAPYAGVERPLCDRKLVVLSDQSQAAADFFLFTSTPIASHFAGMILDDLSNEFNQNSPNFGEKWAPPYQPISVHDWTGRELSRVRADKWGRINGLVPSTFTANVPSPSGYAPNMVTTCMNDPGPVSLNGEPVTDPFYDPRYSTFCYTFQYMPGTTTYLDTPVLPTGAFAAGDPPVDCALPGGTPVIRQVNGMVNGAVTPGPFVNPGVLAAQRRLTILSQGPTAVSNPAYDGPEGSQPKTITRDFGFGSCPNLNPIGGIAANRGEVLLGNTALQLESWSPSQIVATIPPLLALLPNQQQLSVRRCANAGGLASVSGITVTTSWHAADQPLRVSMGQSISDRIEGAPFPTLSWVGSVAASAGPLVLVEPGTYDELVVMPRRVQLQGSGAGSTFLRGVKRPSEKLVAWRERVDALVASGAVSPLPGQEFAGGGIEPDTLNTEEGAVVTVLAATAGPNSFPVLSLDSPLGRPRIDGFTITGGDTGGGIFVNGWAHRLQISNNDVHGNSSYFHGGIRVGRPFLEGLTDQLQPYGFNQDVRIHNNRIAQNAVLQDGTTAGGAGGGGGGVAVCAGSDNYQLYANWICGNFSQGHGGGVAHFGRSDNGQILRNSIVFNQSFNQGLTRSGGGLYIAGEPGDGLSLGAGRNLIVDRNLIQGNHAGAGHGGGVRLEGVNGADRARTPACNLAGSATATNACYQVRLTNNMIVNNVTGGAGGGISMLDAARVQILNNTIARNDSTATIGDVFADPNISTPQPAGIASELHSAGLAALIQGTANDFSNPTATNNIVWQNRSMFYNANAGAAQLLPDVGGAAFTAASCPTSGGRAWRAWDLGVVGVSGATPRLTPTFSILTAQVQHGVNYGGSNNTFTLSDAHIVGEYCNAARSTRLIPDVTTIQVVPALDEGGNFIDVRYGPITLTGNYHLVPNGNPAVDSGTNTGASPDFDGNGRPIGTNYDRGADERGGTPITFPPQ
jgi:FtsP/CotA-like multicopper oxidase with cupredoxin domain